MGNMPRPRSQFADAHLDPAALFEAFRTEDPDYLKLVFGSDLGRPLHLVSDAIRSFVIAAPGHRFIAADYSNIQGAICAWLAGEEWKLTAMREIFADPKNVPDLYRRAAAKIVGSTTVIITKKHPLRQSVGKVSELSLQFQGGVSAFHSMSLNYGVDLNALYEPVWGAADEVTRNKATRSYERALKSKDKRKADILTREAWIACEIIKVGWRAANSKIADSWDELEDAARAAVLNPGVKQRVLGKIEYLTTAGYLWCRLPSGRCIAYSSPMLKDQVWARLKDEETDEWLDQAETMDRDAAERLAAVGKAKIDGACKSKITALGVDSSSQKFVRYPLYGGLFMENLCLAIERDILVQGFRNLRDAGYQPPPLHVYDEIVVEEPYGFGSVEEVERLMCAQKPWADGIPIAASGFAAKRYKKD
jgi:DNA polymerase